MKVLLCFIDMVRVDHLNLYNNRAKNTPLDDFLKSIGGTVFNRCYTPSPDTPRSWACVQTGLLPSFNGCDTRIKWPRYFIKDGLSTIWDHAVEKGYSVNLCCNSLAIDTGMYKYRSSEAIKVTTSISDFLNSDFSDNSISCIGNQDLHCAVDDYCATEYGLRKGFSIIGNYFRNYINEEFISQFDYVFFFSDHGLALERERAKYTSKFELLNDGRNRLLMFCHKKGDASVVCDNRLSSNLDLYATIEDLIGGDEMRQGFSLLREKQRTITHVEDHSDFSVRPDNMLSLWRIITDEFDVRTDTRIMITNEGARVDPAMIDTYLKEYSPFYDYLKKCNKVLDYYKMLASPRPFYFEGSKRLNHQIAVLIKSFYKIKRITMQKIMQLFHVS